MHVRASPYPEPTEEVFYQRALARAAKERLVAYPRDKSTWECKQYVIRVTGERPEQVECNCAGGITSVCKHAACVIFCRRNGVRPIRPAYVA